MTQRAARGRVLALVALVVASREAAPAGRPRAPVSTSKFLSCSLSVAAFAFLLELANQLG